MLRAATTFVLVVLLGLALPAMAQESDLVLLEAEQVSRTGSLVIAEGNVSADVGGLRLDCQRLVYNSDTGVVQAERECIFYWGESYAAADSVTYDMNTQLASMTRVAGRGTDLVHQNRLVETPLFFWAEELTWSPEKVELEEAVVTTCDFVPGDWHYFVESERIEIFPRDKMVASNTSVTLQGTQLYTVPTLVVPLEEDARGEQNYFPSVGYNQVDGAFIRNGFDYYFDRGNFGTLNLDVYQNSGLGYGAEHFFTLGDRGGGNIFYYQQNGSQTDRDRFELRSNLAYRFDEYTNLGLSYNANQFELPGFVSPLNESAAVSLSRYAPGSALQVSSNFARSGDNTNTSYRFYYDVDIDDRWSGLVRADFSRASTRFTSTQRYHYLGSLRRRGELFESELAYERSGGQNTYFLNREPELRLQSKVFHLGPVPVSAAASFGVLEESPSLYRTERYRFDLKFPDQIIETGMGNFHAGAGWRQSLYGNGESQYVLAARAGWLHDIGDVMTARVDYNWQRPEGFTPFQHDLEFSYENLTGGVEFYQTDLWSLSATAGYDLRFDTPHDIISRLDVRPFEGWRLTAAANYNPGSGIWRSLDSGVTMQVTPGVSFTHWSIYDLVNSRLTYQNFALNYEDHDWIASLAYRGVQNELFFQLSLKAFPIQPLKIGPDPAQPVLPANLGNAFTR